LKLPHDKKYFTIAYYAVAVLVIAYAATRAVDLVILPLADIGGVFTAVSHGLGFVFGLISPVLIGVLIAFLLDPAVDLFQKLWRKIRRSKIETPAKNQTRVAGVLFTLLATLLIIAALVTALVVQLGLTDGLSSAENISAAVAKTTNDFSEFFTRIQVQMAEWGVLDYVGDYLYATVDGVSALLQNVVGGALNSVGNAGRGVVKFFLGLVIAVYFMLDKARILRRVGDVADTLFPARVNAALRNFFADVNTVFSGYVRGQLTDAVIMATLISAFLALIKVPFAVVIGIFSGFSNIIPFFGAIIAFALSVVTALFSGKPITALYAAIGVLVLQQIDGMYIAPRVVGRSVKLHPTLILISLSVFGGLFGIPGMIFAVPVTALLKMFFERYLQNRKAKKE